MGEPLVSTPDTPKETIVCVDDEPMILRGLRRQLRGRYEIHTAESGQDGLERLDDVAEVAVVLSDLRMPTMDGIQFLRQVRMVCPDAVRVILTGHGEYVRLSEALEDDLVYRILSKPLLSAELLAAVGDAVAVYRTQKSGNG